MTLIKPIEDGDLNDEGVEVAEQLLAEAAVILGKLISKTRAEETTDIKAMNAAIKEMIDGRKMAVTERNRFAQERRASVGIAGDYAVDFDAARAEIGRRLACLRKSGGE